MNDDLRILLRVRLIDLGCNPSVANLIAVEAGGSQVFVDYNYLNELRIQPRVIKKYLKCITDFYISQLKEI
ncbi:MAG: hypothetical protein M5U17_06045 [Ignavibacterium sp.]|nr:hypothetical protein [Ignavibacterium sp.]